MSISQSRVSLNSILFKNHHASQLDGSIYATRSSSIVFNQVTFNNNSAGISGGAIYLDGDSELNVDDESWFMNNRARQSGGAIHALASTLSLIHVYFQNNLVQGKKLFVVP